MGNVGDVSGASPLPDKDQVQLTEIKETQEPKSSTRIAHEDFGSIKAGGIMGLIARGLQLNEDTVADQNYILPEEALSLPANTQKLIRSKIHDLIGNTDIEFDYEPGTSLRTYKYKDYDFVYGVCNFTIKAGEASTTLTIEIPTNFHPGEVRNFTDRAILNSNETKTLEDNLKIAKASGDEDKIAKARGKLQKHLGDIKDFSPGKMDAEKFINVVKKSVITDAEKVKNATKPEGQPIELDGKPIGEWLKVAHVKMNVSEGLIQSFSKNHTFEVLKFSALTDVFNREVGALSPPPIEELKKRRLAAEIRNDIASSLGKATADAFLDEFVEDQIATLKANMLKREAQIADDAELKKIEDIVTVLNTLRSGKRDKEGKVPTTKLGKLWEGTKDAATKPFVKPLEKAGEGKEWLRTKLGDVTFNKLSLFEHAKYKKIRLSEDQAKTLVEAEGIVRSGALRTKFQVVEAEEGSSDEEISDEELGNKGDAGPEEGTEGATGGPPPPIPEEEEQAYGESGENTGDPKPERNDGTD